MRDQRVKNIYEIGISISNFGLNKLTPNLKKQTPWLEDVDSQSHQGMYKQIESVLNRFFREKDGFPKFKSKKNPIQSFQIPQHYNVGFENNTVKLP